MALSNTASSPDPSSTALATLNLAKALIRKESVTPNDAGCCDLIAARLAPLGFKVEFLRFG